MSLSLLIGFLPCYAHVELISPEGGESFSPDETVSIQWKELIPHNTLNWDLYFSNDGGSTWLIIEEDIAIETLIYAWTVLDDATNEGRIRIVQDNVDSDYEDMSGNFTISGTTAVFTDVNNIPWKVYPNPFKDRAVLTLTIHRMHPLHLLL